ncbi:MAG TPA: SAM-dependent methyltransferase [Rectinemataceae bacterium]|nr:SAM-dependent methyltransferase [Rectinemataceae bacterium]
MSHRELGGCCYHAARGFLDHLLEELPERERLDGELVTVLGPRRTSWWARNVWLSPILIEFASVREAADKLRDIQRNWAPLPARLHRRTALIADRLPPLPRKPRPFPFEVPNTPMGAFTLLDEGLMLASPVCTSPFPNGEFEFEEDHEGPPSRAYRKLWEALLLAGKAPAPGERCLDAGAAPGGWTWAVAGLGASVLAVDRAELDPRISAMPGVESRRGDAFALGPKEVGPVDWLLSDVICYPPSLLAWVEDWVASGLAKNIVCTIKMQGTVFDKATTARFSAIPGGRVVHLWHNRHELCFIRVQGDRGLGS